MVFAGHNPLDKSREKLVNGIRNASSKSVEDVLHLTIGLDSREDVSEYLKEFSSKRNDIIVSENSKDWLIKQPEYGLSALCELD